MSYRRFTGGNCIYSKWTMRCATSVVWALISLLLLFRVLVWHRKHNSEVRMELLSVVKNQSSTDLWGTSSLPITICNVNPIKGFQVFLLPNGSHIYDTISDQWQASQSHFKFLKLLDKSTMMRASHNIQDMLLRCVLSSINCSSEMFHPMWSDYRPCYQVILSRREEFMTLALEPEEHQYMIPGLGFTGFTVLIDNIKTSTNKRPHTEAFYISSTLHTIIKISRSADEDDPQCHVPFQDQCPGECEDRSPHQCTCKDSLGKCRMSYHLLSNYQTTQSSFYHKLSLIKHHKQTSQSCQDVVADLIQKRAVVRLMRKPFFQEILHLSDRLHHINITSAKVISLARSLQGQILSDIVRLQLIEDDTGLCDLPLLLTQLNATLEHLFQLPSNISRGFQECRQETLSAYYQLLIIRMIFQSRSSPPTGPNLSSKVNTLTLMSIKFRDRFSSPESCRNDIARKIGGLYLRLVRDYVSIFLDFSLKYNRFYTQLGTLMDDSVTIISGLRREGDQHNHYNLVTMSVEIAPATQPSIAEPQVYKNAAYPANAISDLVDIICGNLALAALLLLIVRYFSHRCRTKRATPMSVIRRDITTETTDIATFPTDGNIQQITFTL